MAEGGSFGATEESAATGVRRAKRRDSRTEDRCRPALTSPIGLSAHPPGRAGLGAEAQASEVRSQGEDWGWRREHSLKGASAPQLAGREARRRAALTSPRGLSAHPPGRAGAGSWGSGFGASREGVREKVCSCQRGKRLFLAALFCGAQGEGIQSAA